MPDVYAEITEVPPEAVARVAEAMEVSAADPQHREMVRAYLEDLELPMGSRLVEIGCGTGAIARLLVAHPSVHSVVGADPSPILIERARDLAARSHDLSFEVADGRELPFADASFDAAVVHRVLSHVPEPERVLAEAARVVRAGGRLAVFDGDYATITVATSEGDPLQACIDAFAPAYVNDAWIVRRLPALVRSAGFEEPRLRSFGFAQTSEADYMVSIVDRGADALAATGRIGAAAAEALKAEARRRVGDGSFFGHIAYASVVARRPS